MDGASKVVGLATLSAFGRHVTKSHKITSVSDNVSLLNHIKSVFCQIFRKPLIQLFLNIAAMTNKVHIDIFSRQQM